jgi:light-regulated signal transduction histidine kinase (bacteriophytochrome)
LHHVHQSVSCWRAKKALHDHEEALKKNEELDGFVYSISHDLKAPLRGLSGYATILLEDYQDSLDENGKRYLARIGDLSDKMSEMITGLLEYYRAGRIIEPLEIVDLNEVASGVLGRYRPEINAKRIQIIVVKLPKVLCERQKIAQLFSNLIDNAIKFSGDDEPFIKIGCNDCGLEYVISVEDNGIGFDTAHNNEAFKMFGHLDLDGNAKGTGIGLSIAKKIVEMHGGRMWVESEPGAGSVFYFSLPKVAED